MHYGEAEGDEDVRTDEELDGREGYLEGGDGAGDLDHQISAEGRRGLKFGRTDGGSENVEVNGHQRERDEGPYEFFALAGWLGTGAWEESGKAIREPAAR